VIRLSLTLRILALLLVAVGIALASGEIHTTNWGYGLPLPWKFDSAFDCASPFDGGLCPLGLRAGLLTNQTIYNWFLFGLDVLFYTAAGYALLLLYSKFRVRKASRLEND
jgi:hypothetical protein